LASDFEEYVGARMPALLRTAYLLTGDHHDAQDLVQAALIKSVPHWKRITGSPDAYVRRALINESISRWRGRRWREVSTDRLPEVAATTERTDNSELRRALKALAPRQRAVIVLRYYEELSERETAAALGVSVGTVKSQSRDALARLRVLLPQDAHELDLLGAVVE
jgi:RNA polymerase sigma-70 factor (sigma-E family)